MTVTVAWMSGAACLFEDMEMFFNLHQYPRAKRVCDRCPVRMECLEYGLEEPDGIWGGMTPPQRSRMARKRLKRTLASTVRATAS